MMKFVSDKSMWTEEHWKLFNIMEKAFRDCFQGEKFGSNFEEFKKHMLYILQVMEVRFSGLDANEQEKDPE